MSYELFNIYGVDYTSALVRQDYNITREDVTQVWVDGNHKSHPYTIRQKVRGSLKLVFHNPDDYNDFLLDLQAASESDGSVRLYLHVNNGSSNAYAEEIYAMVTTAVQPVFGTALYGYHPFGFEVILTIEEV